MTPGSVPVGPPPTPGVRRNTGSGICPTGDPCVLTGQYSRYRTSTNANETTLATFNGTAAASFGLANFLAFTSTPPTGFSYEPMAAQPLYVTNVSTGTGYKNLVVVGSLNDYVYAFDTASPGSPLWSTGLATDCGGLGAPFNNDHSHSPGGVNMDYYGIVATPVVDTLPSAPIAFVVSACTASWNSTGIEWWLHAIDIQNGTVYASRQLTDTNFNGPYQMARGSLLITHPTNTTTDLYIAFGTGGGELKAADTSCGSNCAYTGVLFGFSVGYHSTSPYVTFTSLTSSPFYATCATGSSGCITSGLFPSVYTGFDTSGAPTGPNCVTSSSGSCDQGDNWFNGGGLWMSSKGPASTSAATVYVASGNGAFACTGSGGSGECTNAGNVQYWGEAAVKFPSASSSTPMAPADFYAPYVQTYTTNKPSGDPSPASYQTSELSRLDLDFGSAGMVIIPHTTTFAMTADKSGYLYVMPAEGNSMGEFQTGDSGLTGGSVTTQVPFQASRLPNSTDSTDTCPVNDDSTWTYSGPACDGIYELAFWNDLLFVWPKAESVEAFQGTYTSASYSFGTTPSFDPCTGGSGNCQGAAPPFPRSNPSSRGAAFALAVDSSGDGTLWGIVPRQNTASTPSNAWGWLYAYSIGSGGALTYLWNNVTGHNCSSPPATGWFTTSFAEPTLANGAAYVPTVCAVTDGNQYHTCADAAAASAVASGVLVFSACP